MPTIPWLELCVLLAVIHNVRFAVAQDEEFNIGGAADDDRTTTVAPPIITFWPNNVQQITVSETGNINANCSVQNWNKASYTTSWLGPDGREISASNILAKNFVRRADGQGKYTCLVKARAGNRIGRQQLDVVVQIPQITVQPLNEDLRVGGVANRRCLLTNLGDSQEQFDYRWTDSTGRVVGSSRDLQLPNLTQDRSGAYTCEATGRNSGVKYAAGTTIAVAAPNYQIRIETVPLEPRINERYTLKCIVTPQPSPQTVYTWSKETRTVGQEADLVFGKFTKSDQGVYECRARGVGGETFDLRSSKDINLVVTSSSKVEMTIAPGPQIFSRAGDKKELHCEVETNANVTGRHVQWYFNDNPLPREEMNQLRVARLDRRYVSILSLSDISSKNEGVYQCRYANVAKEVYLYVLYGPRNLEVNPPVTTVDEGGYSEFHCRVEGYDKVINTNLTWEFVSKDGKVRHPVDLSRWVRTDSPQTIETSFISLEPTYKPDEGFYFCYEPGGDSEKGELIVNVRARAVQLVITPEKIRVRAGQRFQVQCFSQSDNNQPSGTPEFFLKGKRSLSVDNRFQGSSEAAGQCRVTVPGGLSVRDNGTEVECWLDNQVRKAVIIVEDVCETGYRRCDNGNCLPIPQFCDGRQDCSDGSDEKLSACQACDPVARKCEGVNPLKQIHLVHWVCDGEDDCGNGFDESQCADAEKLTCGGLRYTCRSGQTIPRAFHCDRESDCPDNDDEENCSPPAIVNNPSQSLVESKSGQSVTLTCTAQGVPLPHIIWRFNWGCLSEDPRFVVTRSYPGCSSSTSTLTIRDFRSGDDGIYNCEALAGHNRQISNDFQLVLKN